MIPAQPISCISRMLPLGCSDPQVFFCEVDSTPACPSPHSAHLINSATPAPAPARGLAAARAQSGQVVTRTTANRASGSPLPPAPELNVTGPLGNPPEGHPDKSQIKSTELQRGDREAGISPQEQTNNVPFSDVGAQGLISVLRNLMPPQEPGDGPPLPQSPRLRPGTQGPWQSCPADTGLPAPAQPPHLLPRCWVGRDGARCLWGPGR